MVSDNPNVPLAGNVPLDGTGPYAATQVKFQYQLDISTGTWSDIPASNVRQWHDHLRVAGGCYPGRRQVDIDSAAVTCGGPAVVERRRNPRRAIGHR